jgi:hypothetical protein
MKIKTLKIKAGQNDQEIALSDYFEAYPTIYNTSASMVKEGNEYYWYICIAFEPKSPYLSFKPKKTVELPAGFEAAIKAYAKENKCNNIRVYNRVMYFSPELLRFTTLNDFKRLRGIGAKTIEQDVDFLTGLLAVIKSFSSY